ncbi:MAG TPA: GGDEF domain-containing protein [Macromonas sp.]|nr:GGDEF domain-containing protein [Macromonas sp.]
MHSWTLLAANTVMLGCVTGLAMAMWVFNRQVVGLPAWTAAFACAFLGSLNYLVRPHLPPVFAHTSIAMLSVATAYFNLHACRLHLGLPTWRLRTGLLALLAFGALIGGLDSLPTISMPLRFSLFSLVGGGLFLYAGRLLTRYERNTHPSRYLFGLVCILHGLFLALRPLALLRGGDLPADFSQMLDRAQPAIIEGLVAMQVLFFSVLMLVNEYLNTELRRLAQIDPLTDVYNRRAFLDLLDKAVSLGQRHQTAVPLLLIDLDHFKAINDTHGHLQGDQALRHFVGVVQSIIRCEDVLGRLGGEEFAIFLPKTDFAQACTMAERLRAAVARADLAVDGTPVPLTISIGVTACRNRSDIEAAIQRADAAMYRAKEQGRNRVVAAPLAA